MAVRASSSGSSRLPSPRLALCLTLLTAGATTSWVANRSRPLACDPSRRPANAIAGELAGGGSQSLSFCMRRGEFLQLAVVQKGIDLRAELLDPLGALVLVVDGPSRDWGLERIHFVALEPGEYRVVLRADRRQARGRYEVRIEAFRLAQARDRLVAEAARAYGRGETLRRSQGNLHVLRRRALREYTEAVRLGEEAGDQEQEALARFQMGRIHLDLDEPSAALRQLEEVLPRWRERGEEITLLNLMGRSHGSLFQSTTAFDYFKDALALSKARGDTWGQAASRQNLGDTHVSWGELQAALDEYQPALELWRILGEPRAEAELLGSMGQLLAQLGRHEEVVEATQRGLDVLERAGLGKSSVLLRIQGLSYVELERWGPALDALEASLDLTLDQGDHRFAIHVLDAIGIAHLRRGKLDQAFAVLHRALALAAKLGDTRGRAATLANLAEALAEKGDWQRALLYLEEAEGIYESLGEVNTLPAVRYGLALSLRHTGRLAEAKAAFEQSIASVEQLRSKPRSADLRASLLADRRDYYAAAANLLVELEKHSPEGGSGALAFEISERARARSLLDELGEAYARITKGVDAQLLKQRVELERQLASRLWSAATRIAEAAPAPAPSELLAQLEAVETDLRMKSPGYAELSRPRLLTLAEVQRLLDSETVLLGYLLGKERSLLWRITQDDVTVQPLPRAAELESLARSAYVLLSSSRAAAARPRVINALRALSHALLGPVESELGNRRLVVLLDGDLHYIPFGALPDPASDAFIAGWPMPLAARHEIVYLPSASVLAVLRQEPTRRPRPPKTVAVLADPVFELDDPRLAGSSPAARRAAPSQFPRLPHTKREAEAILKRVPAAMSFAAIGFAATRQAVLGGELARYRIVHFATHGLVRSQDPQRSGLVLSLYDERGRPQDGMLRLHDIYNLALPVDLVVLSACETALGPEVRGEGLIGLTRGFMYAGAPRVVVSLWKVNDRATAKLMDLFYEGLLEKDLSAAASLQRAQALMSADPHWSVPHNWAGFVLQGEWR